MKFILMQSYTDNYQISWKQKHLPNMIQKKFLIYITLYQKKLLMSLLILYSPDLVIPTRNPIHPFPDI